MTSDVVFQNNIDARVGIIAFISHRIGIKVSCGKQLIQRLLFSVNRWNYQNIDAVLLCL